MRCCCARFTNGAHSRRDDVTLLGCGCWGEAAGVRWVCTAPLHSSLRVNLSQPPTLPSTVHAVLRRNDYLWGGVPATTIGGCGNAPWTLWDGETVWWCSHVVAQPPGCVSVCLSLVCLRLVCLRLVCLVCLVCRCACCVGVPAVSAVPAVPVSWCACVHALRHIQLPHGHIHVAGLQDAAGGCPLPGSGTPLRDSNTHVAGLQDAAGGCPLPGSSTPLRDCNTHVAGLQDASGGCPLPGSGTSLRDCNTHVAGLQDASGGCPLQGSGKPGCTCRCAWAAVWARRGVPPCLPPSGNSGCTCRCAWGCTGRGGAGVSHPASHPVASQGVHAVACVCVCVCVHGGSDEVLSCLAVGEPPTRS